MSVAALISMALPYPLEVETHSLHGPPPRPGPPLPLGQLVAEAIFCRGDVLFAFGHRLDPDASRSNQQACMELRTALAHRMEERQPFATQAHWARLSEMMHDQLDDGDTATFAEHVAITTVDSM